METENTTSGVTFDRITLSETTNAKGVTIRLGDTVQAKGSKIQRTVLGIARDGQTVRAVRMDGSVVTSSVWMNADKLTVVAR